MVRKRYECSICGKRFHTTQGLQDHTKLRHSNEIIHPNRDQKIGYKKKIIVGDGSEEED